MKRSEPVLHQSGGLSTAKQRSVVKATAAPDLTSGKGTLLDHHKYQILFVLSPRWRDGMAGMTRIIRDLKPVPDGEEKLGQIQRFLPSESDIIDFGSGPGGIAKQLVDLGYNVLAIDISPTSLSALADRPGMAQFRPLITSEKPPENGRQNICRMKSAELELWNSKAGQVYRKFTIHVFSSVPRTPWGLRMIKIRGRS